MVNQRISLARITSVVRRNLWPLCVAALLFSNGLLVWKTHEMRWELSRVYNSVSTVGVHSLMMTSFQGTQNGAIMLHHSCRRYLALFIFTRYDGPFYTDEAVGLNQIVRKRPDIAVFGLMAYATPGEALAFVRQEGLSYPVLADADGSIVHSLDLPRTPWNITFDCARQALVYQGPSVANGVEGQKFLTKLLSFAK